MKLKKVLNEWKIQEVNREDIDETFKECMKYLKEEKLEKYELQTRKQFFNFLLYGQKSWFLAEVVLSISAFVLCGIMVQNLRIFFLSFVSILLAGLMVSNWLRNLSYNMWELENTCTVTTEKMLIYKMLFMSSINIIFLFLLSLYTCLLTPFHFFTVFAYGCIPFFITSAFTLELCMYIKHTATLLLGFMSGNIFSYIFCSYFYEHPENAYLYILLLISLIYGFVTSYRYLMKMERKKESLLWN